eukprot:COSAG01_NODE_9_length_43729_cov_66.133463_5_plen_123_part_00
MSNQQRSNKQQYHLRSRLVFDRVFKQGKRSHHRYLSLIIDPQPEKVGSLAFLCYKKTGNAVLRNKIRRRFKAIFYELRSQVDPATTFLIVGKKPAVTFDYQDVLEETKKVLKKEKLLLNKSS